MDLNTIWISHNSIFLSLWLITELWNIHFSHISCSQILQAQTMFSLFSPSLGCEWRHTWQCAHNTLPYPHPTHTNSENGGSMFHRNTGIHQQDYNVSNLNKSVIANTYTTIKCLDHLQLSRSPWTYEGVSIISGTGAAICTAVAVAQCYSRWQY
jgi:hypothetical protein